MRNTEPVSVAWGGTIWIKLDSAQWLLRQMKISERKVLCLLHPTDALRATKRHAWVDTSSKPNIIGTWPLNMALAI